MAQLIFNMSDEDKTRLVNAVCYRDGFSSDDATKLEHFNAWQTTFWADLVHTVEEQKAIDDRLNPILPVTAVAINFTWPSP
jgi:hypothetical protein